jgi:uncharacterized membrane protein
MTPEEKKSATTKMFACLAAGFVFIIIALRLFGDDNTKNVIGFLSSFVGIFFMVMTTRIAKKIKKETASS